MASKTAADIKAALAKRLETLKEEHANPLQKHPLYPILEDLKLMRNKLGLSYENIVTELKALGLETNVSELKRFFKMIPGVKPAKRGKSATPAGASTT